MKKLKTMLDDRYVNVEMVKELMKFKNDFNDEIDGEIHSVPEFHCQECGDTNPKHHFSPMISITVIKNHYQSSPYICNKCGMTDEHYEKAYGETKAGEQLMRWGSWDGKVQYLKYIDHQHLSNIHYYMNLVHPEYYEKYLKKIVRDLLYEKYGKILPYVPCAEFAYEKIQLIAKGYLDRHGDVRVDGHKIGSYEHVGR